MALRHMESVTTAGAPRASIDWRVDFGGPEVAEHLVAALGARPAFVDEQARYDDIAQAIDDYRERHSISGSDPLGPRPFETSARLAYDEVTAHIRDYKRVRWRELERPFPDIADTAIGVSDPGVTHIDVSDAGLER